MAKKQSLKFNSSVNTKGVYRSLSQIRRLYGPAKTLGAKEDEIIVSDHALENAGVYSLLQHSMMLGQMPQSSFMGYAALQQLSQNALIAHVFQFHAKT